MEHLLAKALHSGKLISFDAMHPSMAKLPSAEDATLAFAEVANAIAYLHSKGGMAALRDAIKRVAAGDDARAAVAAAAGGSWADFERGWRAFMAAQHYKTFPAIDIPTTHIRKPGAIASGPQAVGGGRAVEHAQGERAVPAPAPRQHAAPARPAARGGGGVREGGEGDRDRRPRDAQRSVGGLGLPGQAGTDLPGARRAGPGAQGAGAGAGDLSRTCRGPA